MLSTQYYCEYCDCDALTSLMGMKQAMLAGKPVDPALMASSKAIKDSCMRCPQITYVCPWVAT
jgi:hypothetical protein